MRKYYTPEEDTLQGFTCRTCGTEWVAVDDDTYESYGNEWPLYVRARYCLDGDCPVCRHNNRKPSAAREWIENSGNRAEFLAWWCGLTIEHHDDNQLNVDAFDEMHEHIPQFDEDCDDWVEHGMDIEEKHRYLNENFGEVW